jgi:hypothetical protein
MNTRSLLKPWPIVGVALCIIFFMYVRPVTVLLSTKWLLRNEPALLSVPRPLPLGVHRPSAGRKFSYFGYEFDSPWTELKRERRFESVVVLNFSTGGVIAEFAPVKNGSELDALKSGVAIRGVDLGDIFGHEATRSNYALRAKVLAMSPQNLRLFSSRQEMVANSLLLMIKALEVRRVQGGLFSFQTDWLHGFQEGDPALDNMVFVEAFDSQDQKIELYIGAEPTAKPKPSQTDINQILLSLRPVSASPQQ